MSRKAFRVAFVTIVAAAAALTHWPVWGVVFAAAIGFETYRFVRRFEKAGQW